MNNYKIAAALIGSFVLGAGGASALHAQGTAPYYEVTEIAVKDQTAYEASGVDKVPNCSPVVTTKPRRLKVLRLPIAS